MTATALVSARLEPEVKERAQVILRSAGLTDTIVIRRIYDYIVSVGDVPEFVKTGEFSVPAVEQRDHFDDMVDWMLGGPFSGEDWSWLQDDAVKEARGERWDDE